MVGNLRASNPSIDIFVAVQREWLDASLLGAEMHLLQMTL